MVYKLQHNVPFFYKKDIIHRSLYQILFLNASVVMEEEEASEEFNGIQLVI